MVVVDLGVVVVVAVVVVELSVVLQGGAWVVEFVGDDFDEQFTLAS